MRYVSHTMTFGTTRLLPGRAECLPAGDGKRRVITNDNMDAVIPIAVYATTRLTLSCYVLARIFSINLYYLVLRALLCIEVTYYFRSSKFR